ncbi:DUF3488 and transglutaminase-like domain-containing protein [Yinghuangia sp. ASG 101]|uniref:transglutaminase domain-containing protein n=1 Tax=Yinghuangia sp. ASG 101 TaxID=2896848 RepID=UPI001E547DD6|nr:transglutaminase domain-containing protein [Yinghuangia sp. ASG 101]UGQ10369.1 DUF3488 and transglutaminase-like domain-containing protein [Yinghuangia sp. ASG 101]
MTWNAAPERTKTRGADPPRPASTRAYAAPEPPATGAAGGGAGSVAARCAVALGPTGVLALCAGLAFHRAYGLRAVAPVVALAALVPVAVSALVSRPRGGGPAPLWRSLLAQPLAWFLVGWGILHRDTVPGPALARRMGADLLDAPHRVLTTVAPVPAEGALLVLPFTAVWLAAYAGAELALRTRAVLTPALPAFAVLALAAVVGAGGPGSNVAAAGAFAGATGLLLIARCGTAAGVPADTPAAAREHPGRARASAASIPVVMAAALVAALVAPSLTGADGRTPVSPRDEAAAPSPGPITGGNPLDLVGSWLADPLRPMFRVTGTAASAADAARLADQDWRLAVLTEFDGRTWSPAAALRPTGGRVPGTADGAAASDAGVDTLDLDQRITVQRLGGVWLPAADRPRSIEGPRGAEELAVDTDSGTIATRVPLQDGDTYRVKSQVPLPDPRRVQFAQTADDPAMTHLPDSPIRDRLRELAHQATEGSGFPYQQALRLAQWLRDNHTFDTAAVPGHTYRSLEFFLTESKRGTSEQFATAFAAMARTLGLPARVVVGFHHGTEEADGLQVFGRDAVVWPEVEFADVGWVAFQPTPGEAAGGGRPLPPQAVPEPAEPAPGGLPPGAAVQRRIEDERIIDAERDAPAPPTAQADRGSGGIPWWTWPIAAIATAALVGTGLGAHRALAPWRQRRNERRGDPACQVIAAWRRVGTALHRLGMPDPATLTAEDVAAYGTARLTGVPLTDHPGAPDAATVLPDFAALVNAIAYGDTTPTPARAAEAWHHADALTRAARKAAVAAPTANAAVAGGRP